jgi:UDP-2-acetamido-2,6-beta-L-arabino-hexul-4-ose reductase
VQVVVTGANGFIGQNLRAHLARRDGVTVVAVSRDATPGEIQAAVSKAGLVFHLAGVNRPQSDGEFETGNAGFTAMVCEALDAAANPCPIIYTSSIQAERDNPYGQSKRAAEDRLWSHARTTGASVHVFRLPNVFGKWSRPNYNSAVATFCHNIARDLPISIHDPDAEVSLVYIDDVCQTFLGILDGAKPAAQPAVSPVYKISVGALADQIRAFKASRTSLVTEAVGTGLTRALHATYLSFLPVGDFAYGVPVHGDPRGVFVEMLKTPDHGQFSYFTSKPGITRGIHYHHSKTEKFLVVKGKARFGFRHVVTGDTHEIFADDAKPLIVETIPGWSHDITNIGDEDMVVLLWANEIFDRNAPDTFAHAV